MVLGAKKMSNIDKEWIGAEHKVQVVICLGEKSGKILCSHRSWIIVSKEVHAK